MVTNRFRSIAASLLTLIALFCISFPAGAATAQETYNACVSKLSGAKSLKVDFSTNISGRNASGTLKSKGSKFYMNVAGVSTWYDGKSMTTYSPQNGEATIWIPTKGELAETNPLLYLSTANGYNVKEVSSKKGEVTLALTPKKRGSTVKSVTLVVSTSTNLPKSMKISMSGGTYTATFKSIAVNTAIADSDFVFPRAKFKGVTVTDLR